MNPLYAFIASIYFPSIMIHILSWIPFWINHEVSASQSSTICTPCDDDIPKKKVRLVDMSIVKVPPNVYKTRRFRLALISLILMVIFCTFCSVTILLSIKDCFLNYVWILFMLMMSIVIFHHVCQLEKRDKAGDKRCKIMYPLIFVIFNAIYWSSCFICVFKNTNMC